MELFRRLRRDPVAALFVGLVALDGTLCALAQGRSIWDSTYASALISETALLAVIAVIVPWNRAVAIPLVALCGVLALSFLTLHEDGSKTLYMLALATALWPLPARLSGQRLVRIVGCRKDLTPDRGHSLYQWFLMIAVIGGWIVIVRRFPVPIADRSYLLMAALSSFLGLRIVLGHWGPRMTALLYAAIMFVCGLGGLLISAEAEATMRWTVPPIHEPLAPISSPIDFVTTRLANLRYLDMLNVGLIFLATLFVIETAALLVLRLSGYRVVRLEHRGD
jgi:hypothetical protein